MVLIVAQETDIAGATLRCPLAKSKTGPPRYGARDLGEMEKRRARILSTSGFRPRNPDYQPGEGSSSSGCAISGSGSISGGVCGSGGPDAGGPGSGPF